MQKMKTDNQRREFEFALETLLKASDKAIDRVVINWDESDPDRVFAKTVVISYRNGVQKKINAAYSAWKALAFTTIRRS